jgi:hypothetical protein
VLSVVVNYRVSTNTNKSTKTTQDKTNKHDKKQEKLHQIRLFRFRHELLKVSVDVQTAVAVETHLAEGQWLKEQLNMVKLHMFRVGTRMPAISRGEGQHIAPLKTFIQNKSSQ